LLADQPSGRAFLQHLLASGIDAPETGHFFETLKSGRRLARKKQAMPMLLRALQCLTVRSVKFIRC
jgi:hypothetical protein